MSDAVNCRVGRSSPLLRRTPKACHSPRGFFHLESCQIEVETLRETHWPPPGLIMLPASLGEVIGGGGENVGQRAPDVAAAVTVMIDRKTAGNSTA